MLNVLTFRRNGHLYVWVFGPNDRDATAADIAQTLGLPHPVVAALLGGLPAVCVF